jgi:hypothetical protein
MKLKFITSIVLIFAYQLQAQSDLDKVIKGGEILLGGLSFLKVTKSDPKTDSKIIESMCVKNKLTEKIIFKIAGKDEEGNEIKKELVIQKESKECLLELLKGIYSYEIVLANKEIYKKGEYKFDDEIVITVKQE